MGLKAENQADLAKQAEPKPEPQPEAATAPAWRMVALSDTGLLRPHNEDSIDIRPQYGVAVLADGMGGYNAGEVASAMATAGIADGLAAWLDGGPADDDPTAACAQAALQAEVLRANNAILAKAQSNPECEGMGTTLVACLFHGDAVCAAHLGDSRLYRLRGGDLVQLTKDHSLVQEQIDSGMLSEEDAHLSKNRNCVTRALGIEPDEEAEIHSHTTEPGDLYLLCSDGLNTMLDNGEIQNTLASLSGNLELCAQMLVQAANDAGGRDNISVILVLMEGGCAPDAMDEPLFRSGH